MAEAQRIQIKEEKENPLFGRREVKAIIESETTPSKSQAAEEIANHYSVQWEAIKVLEVKNHFGSPQIEVTFNIYNSKEEKEKYEIKEKKEKEAEEAKKQAEEQAQESQSSSEGQGEQSQESSGSSGEQEQSPGEEAKQ